jgi:hypothetical protein
MLLMASTVLTASVSSINGFHTHTEQPLLMASAGLEASVNGSHTHRASISGLHRPNSYLILNV